MTVSLNVISKMLVSEKKEYLQKILIKPLDRNKIERKKWILITNSRNSFMLFFSTYLKVEKNEIQISYFGRLS